MSALLHIFRRLSLRDRGVAATVCKDWHNVMQDSSLWSVLDLQGSQSAAAVLEALPRIRQFDGKLKEVNLEFANGVQDSHLVILTNYKLEAVNLNACQQLTDKGLTQLFLASPQLANVSLYWNLNVTSRAVASLATCSSSNLMHLNLSGCKRVSDEGIRTLAACCPALVCINLTRCLEITNMGLISLANRCSQLQEIRLYACQYVVDEALQAFGCLAQLTLLDLTGAAQITDAGLKELASCHKLTSIILSWAVQITDTGVKTLAAGCPSLQLISLHGIRGITNKSMHALAHRCANTLHTLDVNGCLNIQPRDKAVLQHWFPKLKAFVVHT